MKAWAEDEQNQVDTAVEKLENAIESLELKEDEGGNNEDTGDTGNSGNTSDTGSSDNEGENGNNEKPAEGTQEETPTTADDVTPILLLAVMMTVAGAGVYLFRSSSVPKWFTIISVFSFKTLF